MKDFSVPRRRITLAVCITLSACAAAPADGSGNTAAAYGAFLAARYADAAQDPATATHYYQSAMRADPNNPALVNEGFIAALLAGSPAAIGLADQVSGNALGVMLLANQAALKGDFAGAAQNFAALPADDIAGLIKPLLLAWSQLGAGNSQAALAGLAPYFDNPEFGSVYVLNAALIADQSGDTKDAAVFYTDAGGGQPNLRLAQILASWQARQGQMAQARAQIEALVATHPDLAAALPAMRAQIAKPVIVTPLDGMAEAYLTLAGTLDQPSQILLRTTFLRFALMLRPNLAAARLLLADLLTTPAVSQAGPGRPPPPLAPAAMRAALATLQPVAADDVLFGPVALQEASLLAALDRPAEAVALLAKLAANVPGNPDPLAAAGDVLRGDGQYAKAIGYYDRALAISGQPPPAGAWSLYFDRAICEDTIGNWKAAEPDLLAALALAPNQPYVLNYIGYSWALRGEKLPQAASMLQQATGLDPNDGAVIDSLGYVKMRQGQTATAVDLLTQAVELTPDDPEVNAHLGDAFAQAGMHLQADYQWQRALSLKPDPKLQAEILGQLKQFEPPSHS